MSEQKKSLGLSTKIITLTITLLVVIVGVNYAVFLSGYKTDAKDAMMEKAAAFTAVADAAKNHGGALIEIGAVDTETLLEEALDHIDAGGHYSETDYFQTIPVVVGWTSAAEAAKVEGLNFEIVSFEARNKENEPVRGSFRDEMLRDLTNQVESGGEVMLGRVNDETNTLHYMRAIKLDQSCMSCHGNPAIYDADGDGKDALGFAMESWPVGYMHGAYEVQMPLTVVDAQVAGFFQRGMMFTVPLLLAGGLGFIFVLRYLLTKPLTNLVAMVQDVATGDGDLTKRLDISRGDEIGRLAHWLNTFLDGLRTIIGDVRDASHQVASSATEIAASAEQMAAGMTRQEEQTGQVSAAVQEMAFISWMVFSTTSPPLPACSPASRAALAAPVDFSATSVTLA
ncbi:MAG: methyl-accepting chemotaxis protein, partial [Planctomycetota bacterium]